MALWLLTTLVLTGTTLAAASIETTVGLGATFSVADFMGRSGEQLPAGSILLQATNVENGLQQRNNWADGYTVPAEQMGVQCRQITNDPNWNGPSNFLYIQVTDPSLTNGAVREVWVAVRYYDDGNGTMQIQYDSSVEAPFPFNFYHETDRQKEQGGNQWRTMVFHLTNVYFGHRQNDGADFRINWDGTNRYIAKVEIYTKEPKAAEISHTFDPVMININYSSVQGVSGQVGLQVTTNSASVTNAHLNWITPNGISARAFYNESVTPFDELFGWFTDKTSQLGLELSGSTKRGNGGNFDWRGGYYTNGTDLSEFALRGKTALGSNAIVGASVYNLQVRPNPQEWAGYESSVWVFGLDGNFKTRLGTIKAESIMNLSKNAQAGKGIFGIAATTKVLGREVTLEYNHRLPGIYPTGLVAWTPDVPLEHRAVVSTAGTLKLDPGPLSYTLTAQYNGRPSIKLNQYYLWTDSSLNLSSPELCRCISGRNTAWTHRTLRPMRKLLRT